MEPDELAVLPVAAQNVAVAQDTPVNSLSMACAGAVTFTGFQDLPFHALAIGAPVPEIVCWPPTARQFVADRQETELRKVPEVPDALAGVHVEPFQVSASARGAPAVVK